MKYDILYLKPQEHFPHLSDRGKNLQIRFELYTF